MTFIYCYTLPHFLPPIGLLFPSYAVDRSQQTVIFSVKEVKNFDLSPGIRCLCVIQQQRLPELEGNSSPNYDITCTLRDSTILNHNHYTTRSSICGTFTLVFLYR